jgi:hypothetical protein
MKVASIGTAAGLVAALALTRFLGGLLYGLGSADPGILASVVLFLGELCCLRVTSLRAAH